MTQTFRQSTSQEDNKGQVLADQIIYALSEGCAGQHVLSESE